MLHFRLQTHKAIQAAAYSGIGVGSEFHCALQHQEEYNNPPHGKAKKDLKVATLIHTNNWRLALASLRRPLGVPLKGVYKGPETPPVGSIFGDFYLFLEPFGGSTP